MSAAGEIHEAELNALLASVPSDFTGPREIWRRFGRWAPRTVRQWLFDAAKHGVIERRSFPTPTGFEWKYRTRR